MSNDIIDISLDFENLDNINFGNQKKTNFGGGIELLMNDKKSDNSGHMTSDINIDDLNNLENELNNLSNDTFSFAQDSTPTFGSSSFFNDETPSVRFNDTPSIGKATSSTENDKPCA